MLLSKILTAGVGDAKAFCQEMVACAMVSVAAPNASLVSLLLKPAHGGANRDGQGLLVFDVPQERVREDAGDPMHDGAVDVCV